MSALDRTSRAYLDRRFELAKDIYLQILSGPAANIAAGMVEHALKDAEARGITNISGLDELGMAVQQDVAQSMAITARNMAESWIDGYYGETKEIEYPPLTEAEVETEEGAE